jgi:protein phosphatase
MKDDLKVVHDNAAGVSTDMGAVRKLNEDAFLANPGQGVWLVADGMGGHQNGDVASAIARDTVAESIASGDDLTSAIQLAHRKILDEALARENSSGMGSTIVAVAVDGNDYEVAWVGDSRAYLWDGNLMQITKDHSYVRDLVESGAITPEEAKTHPSRHLLIRCLGAEDDGKPLEVETRRGRFSRGQELLLCSDGLTGELADDDISAILAETTPVQDRVDKLVRAAVDHGGQDNVTVLLVPAPESARGAAGWKTAGLVLGGAVLAACILGVAFYLQQQGVF